MNLLELKSDIIDNKLRNFYIFTGDEIGIMNIYLKEISKVSKMPIVREDNLGDIYQKCSGSSMFSSSGSVYVIRNDSEFMKQDKVYSKIEEHISGNIVILLYDKLDSRLKFTKHFKGSIIEFEKLTPQVLSKYITAEIKLNKENVQTLIDICNGSYDICLLEIDKIHQICTGKNYDSVFTDLVNDGFIYQKEDSDVFKFSDAVCTKKKSLAYKIETILRNNGVSSINILGTLYNSFRNVMLIQSCDRGENITEITGLDKGQIYFNKNKCGYYEMSKLISILKNLASIVEGIKSGTVDEKYAVRLALLDIYAH